MTWTDRLHTVWAAGLWMAFGGALMGAVMAWQPVLVKDLPPLEPMRDLPLSSTLAPDVARGAVVPAEAHHAYLQQVAANVQASDRLILEIERLQGQVRILEAQLRAREVSLTRAMH